MAVPVSGQVQPCFYCQKSFRSEVLDQHLRECTRRQDFARRNKTSNADKEVEDTDEPAEMLQKWECPLCTFENDPTAAICEICRSGQRPAAGDLWVCLRCTFTNNKALTHCKVCSSPRDARPQPAAPSGLSSGGLPRPVPPPVPQPVMPQRIPPRQPAATETNPFNEMIAQQRNPRPPPPVRPDPSDDPFADVPDPDFVTEHRVGSPIGAAPDMIKQSSDGFDGLPELPPSASEPQDMDVDDEKIPPIPADPSVEDEQAGLIDEAQASQEADAATAELLRAMMQAEQCGKCGERGEFSLPCDHLACANCVSQYLRNGLVRQSWRSQAITCPIDGCDVALPSWAVNSSGLSESHRQKIDEMQTSFLTTSMDNLIKCPKCPNVFEGEAGEVTAVMSSRRSQGAAHQQEIGLDGQPLTQIAAEHKAAYRFRCANCTTVFCKQCKVFPYHLGYTCESWASYQEASKCRFCAKRLEPHNTARPDPRNLGAGLESVCTDEECIKKRALSCAQLLECGHACCGIKGELHHLPCMMDAECPNSQGVDGEDYCNICWVESLNQAPCVRLDCGHYFHFSCVREKIEKKWPGARVTFGFLNCPLCKREIRHEAITALAGEYFQLKQKIKEEALERLQIEGLHEDPRILDRKSPYFNKPEDFALDRLAYYLCNKCGKPYFGGMRACEEAGAQQDEKYNAEHLVCPGCAAGPNAKACPRHGKKYITYKCKFCCTVASWFCWGNTHFCDSCHTKQERGDYLNRKPIEQLPRCPGMPDCPLAVVHPPNGLEDFALGCVVCLKR